MEIERAPHESPPAALDVDERAELARLRVEKSELGMDPETQSGRQTTPTWKPTRDGCTCARSGGRSACRVRGAKLVTNDRLRPPADVVGDRLPRDTTEPVKWCV